MPSSCVHTVQTIQYVEIKQRCIKFFLHPGATYFFIINNFLVLGTEHTNTIEYLKQIVIYHKFY